MQMILSVNSYITNPSTTSSPHLLGLLYILCILEPRRRTRCFPIRALCKQPKVRTGKVELVLLIAAPVEDFAGQGCDDGLAGGGGTVDTVDTVDMRGSVRTVACV